MSIERARTWRAAKAAALAQLEAGQMTLMQALRDPPDALGRVDLWYVLLRTPGLGRKGSTRLCKDADVWPHLYVQDLTPRQLDEIEANLPERLR